MDQAWRGALDAAIGGDPGPALAALARGDDDGGAQLALRAAIARVDPARARMPTLEEVRAAPGAAGAIAAALLARDAVSRLDGPAIVAAAEVAGALAGADERAAIEAEHALAWSLLARGTLGGLRETARALEARASRARLAHLVIDGAALAALAALAEDDLAGALALARRASRMARTESLPLEEYLANVALARVRRHAGRPHLATRILAALARVAPAAWQGWLALELELAGARDVAARALARADASRAGAAAVAVGAMISSAARGDRRAFDGAVASAREASGAFAPIGAELAGVARAIDPAAGAADPAGGALAAFLTGESDAVPGWLAGPASIPRAGEAHAMVRALAAPGVAGRRVLAVGMPLAAGAADIGREAGAKQHRRETALAILVLAGPDGIAKDALFRAVWGFAFVPHLHQGVLDVLLHRVRAALGEAGDLVRRESRIALVLRAPIAVADPRAEQPLDDRVLALVSARGGAARARDLAQELDVPLRTVQAALARLVEGGDCLREGDGQNVAYRVEDTTFREPTRA